MTHTQTQRQATIDQAFDLRKAELDCQAAQANALTTFLSAADRAAHWNGMVASGKQLIVAQRLGGLGIEATDEAITYWVNVYEGKYCNEVVTE